MNRAKRCLLSVHREITSTLQSFRIGTGSMTKAEDGLLGACRLCGTILLYAEKDSLSDEPTQPDHPPVKR